MTPEEFKLVGYRVIDWIADYRQRVEQFPVMSQLQPGQVRERLPTAAPEQRESFDEILRDLDEIVVPGVTHWQSPNFFAYFPGMAPFASILGDLVSTGLGVVGVNWQSCPALTELEEAMADWMRQLVGLSSAWRGVIQDAASTSAIVALICARERSTQFGVLQSGLQHSPARMTVYMSQDAHSSVRKAAAMAGFGENLIRIVGVDDNRALDVSSLAALVAEDLSRGCVPCAVIATTGTTTTTAMDPLAAIAQVAHEVGMWLHVDAAMGGNAMVLPECRPMWAGVEQADSVVFNPYKWLCVPFDCSMYFVRDSEHLIRVMSTNPSYLQTSHDHTGANLRDWGLPLGRRFRALKLWFSLREQGAEAIRARLRRDMSNARWLAEQAYQTPGWHVVAPVTLQTVCLRHEPANWSKENVDRHTLSWAEQINRGGTAFLTPANVDGRWLVRVSIGVETTERHHVARLWETMQKIADASATASGPP